MSLSVPGMLLGAVTAGGAVLAIRSLRPRRTPLEEVLRRTHSPRVPPFLRLARPWGGGRRCGRTG